jgi:hypothetical protein
MSQTFAQSWFTILFAILLGILLALLLRITSPVCIPSASGTGLTRTRVEKYTSARMCVSPHCDANRVGRGRIRSRGLDLNLKSGPPVPPAGLLRRVSM